MTNIFHITSSISIYIKTFRLPIRYFPAYLGTRTRTGTPACIQRPGSTGPRSASGASPPSRTSSGHWTSVMDTGQVLSMNLRRVFTPIINYRAFSWLKVPTGAFTFKTLFQDTKVDVKFGRRCKDHQAVWLA